MTAVETIQDNPLARPQDALIEALQAAMLEFPQVEPPTHHTFHGGMYLRQAFVTADSAFTGKKHRKDHFLMVVQGQLAIVSNDGVKEVMTAPHLLVCKAGTRRAFYAVTDCLFMTFHATEAEDVESAEFEIVEDDPTSPFTVGNKLRREVIEQ